MRIVSLGKRVRPKVGRRALDYHTQYPRHNSLGDMVSLRIQKYYTLMPHSAEVCGHLRTVCCKCYKLPRKYFGGLVALVVKCQRDDILEEFREAV